MSRSSSVNDIDLTKYVAVMWRRWWCIVAGAVLGALLAYGFTAMQSTKYRAEATLALVRAGNISTLDTRVRTVSSLDPYTESLDQFLRRRSLLVIAESQDLGAQVLKLVGPLPSELGPKADIMDYIDVSLESDVVRVQANMTTREGAAALANAFARVYAQNVNALFGETTSSTDSLRAETTSAQQVYIEKEKALADFVATSTAESTRRRMELLSQQVDASTRTQVRLMQLEQDARALRERVAKGDGATPGVQLAQFILEANAFNSGFDAQGNQFPSIRLETVPQNFSNAPANPVASVDELIVALQTRRAAEQAAQQSSIQELKTVRAESLADESIYRQLDNERNLAWDTYKLLATQLTEAESLRQTNQAVRLLTVADGSSARLASRQSLITLIGAALGAIVGAAVALGLDYLPLRKRRAASPDSAVASTDGIARSN